MTAEDKEIVVAVNRTVVQVRVDGCDLGFVFLDPGLQFLHEFRTAAERYGTYRCTEADNVVHMCDGTVIIECPGVSFGITDIAVA